MQQGDHVILLSDPLGHGTGKLRRSLADGQVVVLFGETERPCDPQDLELLSVWMEDVPLAAMPGVPLPDSPAGP